MRLFLVSLSLVCLCVSVTMGATVARVGNVDISSHDIAYRVATERVYGNNSMTEAAALVSLINEAFEKQVAESVGVSASPEEVSTLDQHANNTSKAPEVLSKVKDVFGADTEAYNRLYLAPKVVNRKLHQYFGETASIQTDARNNAEAALSALLGGKTFEEAAAAHNGTCETLEVANDGPPNPLVELLTDLPVGQIYPEVINDENSFKVVRLISSSSGVFNVQALSVPKVTFAQWFRNQASGIAVDITDGTLSAAVRSGFDTVWWVGELQ